MKAGTIKGSGIYRIRHIASGKVYVGSAVDIADRWSAHRRALATGFASRRLQNAWLKYGAEAFVFEVIENVSERERLLEREQFWIDELQAFDDRHGYNIAPKAGSQLGVRFPPDVRERMGRPIGLPMAPETRAALAAARVPTTREMALKAWATRRERGTDKWTDEQRARKSVIHTGKKLSAETKRKIGAAGKLRKRPDTSALLKELWRDPEASALRRANIGAALRGRIISEDQRRKTSATVKRLHAEGRYGRRA